MANLLKMLYFMSHFSSLLLHQKSFQNLNGSLCQFYCNKAFYYCFTINIFCFAIFFDLYLTDKKFYKKKLVLK